MIKNIILTKHRFELYFSPRGKSNIAISLYINVSPSAKK